MKKLDMSAVVEDDVAIELSNKITKLIKEKKGTGEVQISEVQPKGSGLTLRTM